MTNVMNALSMGVWRVLGGGDHITPTSNTTTTNTYPQCLTRKGLVGVTPILTPVAARQKTNSQVCHSSGSEGYENSREGGGVNMKQSLGFACVGVESTNPEGGDSWMVLNTDQTPESAVCEVRCGDSSRMLAPIMPMHFSMNNMDNSLPRPTSSIDGMPSDAPTPSQSSPLPIDSPLSKSFYTLGSSEGNDTALYPFSDKTTRWEGEGNERSERFCTAATLGTSDKRSGEDEADGGGCWQRQCGSDLLPVKYSLLLRSSPTYTMNRTRSTHQPTGECVGDAPSMPPEPPPSHSSGTSTNNAAAASSSIEDVGTCYGHQETTSYKEDIRDFDIYRLTPRMSEPHVPPLPALPTNSDTDTDTSTDSSPPTTLRRRKRRNVERMVDGVERKRQREYEDEEEREDMVTNRLRARGDNSSLLPSPAQLRQTTTTAGRIPTAILQSSSNRQKSSSGRPSSTIITSINTNTSREDDNNDIISCEDEDDEDEASTVVPDDFSENESETDSDIEVLTQSESWVDLSQQQPGSPDRVTPLPPFGNGEEYIRLLREAQRESNQSSERVSLASSRRDTPRDSPHDSPKSPPNSPNTELTTDQEEPIMKGVYINYYNKEGDFIRVDKNTDWIWDWSSRPDQSPPKEWRFSHPTRKGVSRGASIRRVMVGNSSLFSRPVLYTLLITNVISLLIGTGIGIYLSKRSGSAVITTLPIN